MDMIVDPDFLDHWRTGMVCDALGDLMAPMYILRLWAHCQERKSDTFTMPVRGLKAQCKFPGDAAAFEQALIEAGFIERNGDSIHVCGWAEKNASLVAAWENGAKGGRPRKPKENPTKTQQEPSQNPTETHAKPIREEKSREDSSSLRSEESAPASRRPRATRKCPDGFEITDALRVWATENARSVDIVRETDKFRDYTFKTAHADWDGAWRNWMRRAAENTRPPSRASPPQSKHAAAARAIFGAPHPEIVDV